MTSSLWIEDTQSPQLPRLDDDLDVDVAVVGAGIAGILTAYDLILRGKSVALLEAGRVAQGTSGHTTAKVSVQHTLIYDHLARTFGEAAAELYAESQQDALVRIRNLVADLAIDCDLEDRSSYTYVSQQTSPDVIRREVDAAQAAGLPAGYVEAAGLPFETGPAIGVDGQAQFHPRKFLLGVLAAFLAQGGMAFEHTRVVGLDFVRQHRLTTDAGRHVVAKAIVTATHFPVFDRTIVFPRLTPHREWVVAGPIPRDDDPQGMYITPDGGTRSVRTAPLDEENRLLIVTGSSSVPGKPGAAARLEDLTAWASAAFPRWRRTHHWAAQDHRSTDRLPFVGRTGTRWFGDLYIATGFGGWGMTNGMMSAALNGALIDEEDVAWSGLYSPMRLHPRSELKPLVNNGVTVARHLVMDRVRACADGIGSGTFDDLAPGSGKVVRHGLEWIAVARDDAGEVHAVSARCSHLGCVVGFNDEENTWECPCHGSRFALDGALLHGPATSPLSPVESAPQSHAEQTVD